MLEFNVQTVLGLVCVLLFVSYLATLALQRRRLIAAWLPTHRSQVIASVLIGALLIVAAIWLFRSHPASKTLPSSVDAPQSPQYYSLTNEELQRTAMSFAAKLRSFDKEHEDKEERIRNDEWTQSIRDYQPGKDLTKEEAARRREIMAKQNAASSERFSAMRYEFQTKFQATATTLVNALRGRIANPPTPINGRPALDGTLAGPHAVSELATYIEMLAMQLPR